MHAVPAAVSASGAVSVFTCSGSTVPVPCAEPFFGLPGTPYWAPPPVYTRSPVVNALLALVYVKYLAREGAFAELSHIHFYYSWTNLNIWLSSCCTLKLPLFGCRHPWWWITAGLGTCLPFETVRFRATSLSGWCPSVPAYPLKQSFSGLPAFQNDVPVCLP